VLALLILAQGRGEQDVGGSGPGVAIIVGVLVLIAIAAYLLFKFMARGSRASKGGVQPPAGEAGRPHPSPPPLESVEPRS
jgi:hypothetical protein